MSEQPNPFTVERVNGELTDHVAAIRAKFLTAHVCFVVQIDGFVYVGGTLPPWEANVALANNLAGLMREAFTNAEQRLPPR